MPQYTSGGGGMRPKKDIEEPVTKNFNHNDRRWYSTQNIITTLVKATTHLFQRKGSVKG